MSYSQLGFLIQFTEFKQGDQKHPKNAALPQYL